MKSEGAWLVIPVSAPSNGEWYSVCRVEALCPCRTRQRSRQVCWISSQSPQRWGFGRTNKSGKCRWTFGHDSIRQVIIHLPRVGCQFNCQSGRSNITENREFSSNPAADLMNSKTTAAVARTRRPESFNWLGSRVIAAINVALVVVWEQGMDVDERVLCLPPQSTAN